MLQFSVNAANIDPFFGALKTYKPKKDGIAYVPASLLLELGDQEKADWRNLMARYVTQRYRASGFAILSSGADVGSAKVVGQVFYAAGLIPWATATRRRNVRWT